MLAHSRAEAVGAVSSGVSARRTAKIEAPGTEAIPNTA